MGLITFGAQRLMSNARDLKYRLQSPIDEQKDINGVTASFRQGTETERVAIEHVERERTVIKELLGSIEKTDVFLDIGGNIGQFACFIGQIIETHSVEPYSPSHRALSYNFEQNNCIGQTYQAAVSTQEKLTLSVPILPKPGWQTTSTEGFGRPHIVPGVKGSDLIEKHSPTVMKIDVEGAEADVLRSFNTLENFHTIFLEVHKPHWRRGETDSKTVRGQLKSEGFILETIDDHGIETSIKATRNP